MSARTLPVVCLLVKDVRGFCKFLKDVFDCGDPRFVQSPCNYAAVDIQSSITFVIVNKDDCDPQRAASFASIAVKQTFLTVADPQAIQIKAVNFGAQVIENDIDPNGGIMCAFEGPEGIIFHLASFAHATKLTSDELFMSLVQPRGEDDEDDYDKRETIAAPSKGKKNPRPQINTLNVTLLSEQSKAFINCPPNAREPIPFETEVREI